MGQRIQTRTFPEDMLDDVTLRNEAEIERSWPKPSGLPAGALPSPGDPINHPPHYTFGKYEVIDVIEDWGLSYHLGTVLKYVARSKHKGSELQDLRKAKFFLDRVIQKMEQRKG